MSSGFESHYQLRPFCMFGWPQFNGLKLQSVTKKYYQKNPHKSSLRLETRIAQCVVLLPCKQSIFVIYGRVKDGVGDRKGNSEVQNKNKMLYCTSFIIYIHKRVLKTPSYASRIKFPICPCRLEERYVSAYRHRHRLPDPGQLLRPLHLCYHLYGRMEEGLCCHGGAPHHHAGAHQLLLRIQVLFVFQLIF